jgi:hypothetical protein
MNAESLLKLPIERRLVRVESPIRKGVKVIARLVAVTCGKAIVTSDEFNGSWVVPEREVR